ncbi:MAG: hypothetical protein GSR84_01710 [Desulfurococcales archaeon]|nr:hypothetical protein [Desulfurococcales archaeon]
MGEYKVAVIGDKYNNPLFRSAGLVTIEAYSQDDVVRKVVEASRRDDIGLIIVLKHMIEDEETFRDGIKDVEKPVLILPTRWATAEPINVDKLLAKALGLG